ncbi:MAG: carboxypeptidase regulatory-like domain-containing protein [Myxococcota bacterium]
MAASNKTKQLSLFVAFVVFATFAALGIWMFIATPESTKPDQAEATTEETEDDFEGIAGTVVDSTGAPVEGATVSTVDGPEARTDETGRFALEGVAPGTYQVDAEADGFATVGPASMRRVEVTLSEGQAIQDLRLTLRRPATLSGRIVAGGDPIEGARVGLYYLFAEGLDGRLQPFALDGVTESEEDGAFELDGIAPGRFHVLVEADGHALAESQEVYLEPGESRGGLVIDLDPSALLTGEVVDEEGEPLSAELNLRGGSMARSRTITANERGKFVFRDISPGTYVLEARAQGYRTELIEDLEVADDQPTERNVVMKPASGIFGQVLTPEGEAAPNAFVYVMPDQGRRRVLRTGDDGRFEWPDAPRPSYTATAISRHYGDSESQRIRPGEEARLTLGGSGSVSGRVVGPNGNPVQSFSVGVESFEVDGIRPYRPASVGVKEVNDSRGRFRFDSLRPGTYWFRVQTPQFASETSDRVLVRAGSDASGVVIRVGAGGRISGTVTDEQSGEPVAGARVVVFEPGSPFSDNQTRTDSRGRYSLDGVPPGRRSVRVNKNGYLSTVAAGVDVRPNDGAERNVQIRKQKPGERMQFHGIGAVLRKTDGAIRVMNVMEGHPAAEFGLKRGDSIRSVDREPVDGMRLKSVIEQIRGQQGVPVELEIEREGQGRMTLEIERGRVVVKNRGRQ